MSISFRSFCFYFNKCPRNLNYCFDYRLNLPFKYTFSGKINNIKIQMSSNHKVVLHQDFGKTAEHQQRHEFQNTKMTHKKVYKFCWEISMEAHTFCRTSYVLRQNLSRLVVSRAPFCVQKAKCFSIAFSENSEKGATHLLGRCVFRWKLRPTNNTIHYTYDEKYTLDVIFVYINIPSRSASNFPRIR